MKDSSEEGPLKTEHKEIKTECDDYDDSFDNFPDDFLETNVGHESSDQDSSNQSDQEQRLDAEDPIVPESRDHSIVGIMKTKRSNEDDSSDPIKKAKKKRRIKFEDEEGTKTKKKKKSKNQGALKMDGDINAFQQFKIKKEKVRSTNPKAIHPCHMCSKHFTTATAAKNHLERIHFRIRKIICDLCGFKNFTKSDLIRHMSVSFSKFLWWVFLCINNSILDQTCSH